MTFLRRETQSPVLNNAEFSLPMLLEKIFMEHGKDFRNYKRSTIFRRLQKRLNALNVSTYGEYSSILEANPSEYQTLFSNLTVRVSEFFREPPAFSFLENILQESFSAEEPIKAWSCGCANGEEAYSLAIILSNFLDAGAFMASKVFATDIDHGAVEQSRLAIYRDESLSNVEPHIKEMCFLRTHGQYKVKYNIRNIVKFGVLDIVTGSPIGRVQVLLCRNLFIYFNKGLQDAVFAKLDYSLMPGGILLLGRAELIPQCFSSGYTLLNKPFNIYRKKG
ncbi:MAG: protein-glutamate O-methyltransferase CheR [Deltaproteobacteria bacterium]